MVGLGPYQEESMGSRRQDNFLNLERKRDREGSTHTGKSHSWVRSHVSQEQNERAMQREINDLKKKLHHAQRQRTPSSSDVSSNDEEDASYRQRSRTPPSESFSYNEKHHHRQRYNSWPYKGSGNNAMSKYVFVSNTYSNNHDNLPGNSSDKDVPHEHTRKKET